ncbi:unnamed protein product [Hymenolepis diminuta]|uniref:Uncharacterized protein n=1 Tax=Hymenolepis diminuta TaxID=6216 RepID=A0A158QEF9_HYMDI|nr:unnamed protein product [Hymenolepis diminuta]
MNLESPQRKPPSPRSCTEVVSLQNNRLRNQEGLINFSWLIHVSAALERGLQCRRSVKDLTADMLKRKIEKRPDKQVLINHRILKPGEAGTSAFIQERCHALTKNQLCESLNSKLERRPGSLELVEKGVLQVDPGVANLIRGGSIPYPRVASTSPTQLYTVPENEPIVQPPSPPPPPPDFSKNSSRNSLVGGGKLRTPSRSLKDETVISRYGSLVFHNYRPLSAANSNSPSLRVDNSTPTERLPKHRAREVQQAELLNLEDAAQVHRKVGQEICQLKGCPPHKIAQNINEEQQQQTRITQQQIFSPILAAAQSQTPHPQQQCFLISTPATQQTPASVTMVTSPQPSSTQSTQPPPVQMKFSQIFSNQSIFDDGSGTLVALNGGSQTPQGNQQQTQHQILSLAPSPATKLTTPLNTEPTKQGVPSLEQIETVWLDLRRLQQEITEEASHYGLNIVSSDGFPGAFCVATANESEVNSPAYQQLRDLSNQHNRLCSLARLLICDRLDYLDRADPFIQHHGDPSAAACGDQVKQESSYNGNSSKGGSELERSLLQSYLSRLGGNYQRFGATHLRRPRQTPHPTNGTVNGTATNGTNSNPCWRNSTILPAHSESVFYQQQMQLEQQTQQIQQIYQPIQQKINGSLLELPSNVTADSWHFCSADLQTIAPTMPVATMMTTTSMVGSPLIHTTSSMPANLHLGNTTTGPAVPGSTATAMILSPANAFDEITNGNCTSVGNPVHVTIGTMNGNDYSGGNARVFMPSSVGGSSGSSAPVLTAESSACSIPAATVENGHQNYHHNHQDDFMSMELSPEIPLSTDEDDKEEIPDLLDVQNFLSKFPFTDNDEEDLIASIGLDSNNSNSDNSTNNNTDFNSHKNDLKLPPGPQFFIPPGEDFWNLPGLMDMS